MLNNLVKHTYGSILKPSLFYQQADVEMLILEQIKHYAIWSGKQVLLGKMFRIDKTISNDKSIIVVYSDKIGGLRVTDTYRTVREDRKIDGIINILFSDQIDEIQVRTRLGVVVVPDAYFDILKIELQNEHLTQFSIYGRIYTVQRNIDSRLSLHVE
jgi:hypothetical protein